MPYTYIVPFEDCKHDLPIPADQIKNKIADYGSIWTCGLCRKEFELVIDEGNNQIFWE